MLQPLRAELGHHENTAFRTMTSENAAVSDVDPPHKGTFAAISTHGVMVRKLRQTA